MDDREHAKVYAARQSQMKEVSKFLLPLDMARFQEVDKEWWLLLIPALYATWVIIKFEEKVA